METGNKVDQAENQHKLLEEKLSELQESSQHVAMEAAKLVKTREELEIDLAVKKKCKERLLTQKPFMTDTELFCKFWAIFKCLSMKLRSKLHCYK